MALEKKATIREVAGRAGVSISSVSRVLSGHPHVSEALRVRVEAAVKELRYQPDLVALSLRRGYTYAIGFLVGNLSNPVIADISDGAAEVLASHGYVMSLICSQNNPQLDVSYLRFLSQRQVDGLIVSSAAHGPDQAGPLLVELELPTVMLDRDRLAGAHISAVQSDHISGMKAAVSHLLAQGHQRIGLIGGPEFFYPARMRLAGLKAGLDEAGLQAEPSLIRSVGMQASAAYIETLSLLSYPSPPTALIAGGNLILVGMLQALQERGIVVGRDIAIVGCDDTALTRLYTPPITVITRDLRLLGEIAARLLLETMNQGGGRTTTLPTRLVIRGSSMCSPRSFKI
jgi:LacI family transcriptional regulator